MEAVRGGIENSIRQLSGAPPPGNMASFKEGAGYVHPARTADEIKADMAARRQSAQTFEQVFTEEASENDDLFAKLSRTIGDPLPEVTNATTKQSDDDSPVPWVF